MKKGDIITGANSVIFSVDGGSIFAGFENEIQIFDTSRPGSEMTQLKTVQGKKSRKKSFFIGF